MVGRTKPSLCIWFLLLLQLAASQTFSYDKKGADWRGLCAYGTQQSPIDLVGDDAIKVISSYDETYIKLTYHQWWVGHTFPDGGAARFDSYFKYPFHYFGYMHARLPDSLSEQHQFDLQYIQFHEKSEHTVNGERYELEMQLVNLTVDDIDDPYAVIVVMFKEGAENKFLKSLIWDQFLERHLFERTYDWRGGYNININEWIYYTGSFTTPNCEENVNWFIHPEIQEASRYQIEYLSGKIEKNGARKRSYQETYRETQSLNGRQLQYFNSLGEFWSGECNNLCYDCTGPKDSDCSFCIDHASKTYETRSRCVCDPNWSGKDCEKYTDVQYVGVGECDPKCFGGCTGPTARDWVRCIENAHIDQLGACVCDNQYIGINCDQPDDPACDARCYEGCSGPTNYECKMWVVNSHLTDFGACVCDDRYTGLAWEEWIEFTDCNPICDEEYECYGFGPQNCEKCTTNAHMNFYGFWECDKNWFGADCSEWRGTCDHKCHHGCYGPTASDCVDCVDFANFVEDACVCRENWGGDGCTIYLGECNPICVGCHGHGGPHCDFCVEHATKNEYGVCQCDWEWSGESCKTYVYQGACDPICVGCTGPTRKDCNSCVQHAFLNDFDECMCDAYYTGNSCEIFAYTGLCHNFWDGSCWGPEASDCVQCVLHAHRDDNSNCVCDLEWTGQDCSHRLYMDTCHPVCDQRYGCKGTTPGDCVYCNYYAQRDFEGHCQCKTGYQGDNCYEYTGPCHPKCGQNIHDPGLTTLKNWYGPTACECYECVDHAYHDEEFDGCCKCDKFWDGPACENYTAECHPICERCYGPSACDCEECVEHAYPDSDKCVCEENWDGEDCSIWTGACHPNCKQPDDCIGPESCDCTYCINHAAFNDQGVCECIGNWFGQGCVEFDGLCHPVCATCSGPNANDCNECVTNAEFANPNDPDGFCACSRNWSGLDCSEWIGDCDIRCDGCTSPNPCDCKACVANAHFDLDGLCACDALWSGYSCSQYHGYCDQRCIGCFGPSNIDWEACARNTYRNNLGGCECFADWRGNDCSVYGGECDPTCANGCFGPMESDCIDCVDHSTRDESSYRCLCDEWWTGPDCSYYRGECALTWVSCTGVWPHDVPNPGNQGFCETCVAHAHRDSSQGHCICDQDWTGEDCTEYVGCCWKTCAVSMAPEGCHGPTELDCAECREHAHRSHNGHCVWDEDWSDAEQTDLNDCNTIDACSKYAGKCDPLCADGCEGPYPSQCNGCVTNAWLVMGDCKCKPDWSGSMCQYYTGECSSYCDGCTNAGSEHCIQCGKNATRDFFTGACVCQQGWTGDFCGEYTLCDPICDSGDRERLWVGPGPLNCTVCVINAHRNHLGACECNDGWTGSDCTQYDGVCNPKCAFACHGPSAYDCNSCVEHAIRDDDSERTLDQECVCQQWWAGDDCSIYQGPCASTCHGCSGPEANNCQDCVKHAYHDANGHCICRDEWTGDKCDQKRGYCHETCELWVAENINECLSCKDGFTLVNGYCVPCSECCQTCEASNGTASSQCTSCHPGFGLDSRGGCAPCHPTCKTCSRGWVFVTIEFEFSDWYLGACTSCHEDSTLTSSGKCQCDFPKVRVGSSFTCESQCPTGTVFEAVNGYCRYEESGPASQTMQPDVHLVLDHPAPIFNTASPNSDRIIQDIFADSCSPPLALGDNRGAYFNRLDQYLQIHNLILHQIHSVEMWTNIEEGDVTLFSAMTRSWPGWDSYEPSCQCQPYDINDHVYNGILDFYISACYTPVVQIENWDDPENAHGSNVVMTETAYRIKRGWTKIGYSLINYSDDSVVSIYKDEDRIVKQDLNFVLYKHIGMDAFLGGHQGLVYTMKGFIYDFKYVADIRYLLDVFTDIYDVTLNMCDWNQYLDAEGECEECDPTCTHGCTSGDICYECHESCRTCIGHSNDECVDCYCGAERDFPYNDASCCNCTEGMTKVGGASTCKDLSCNADQPDGVSCESCLHGRCILCSYGYHWVGGYCHRCDEGDHASYRDDSRALNKCSEKGFRKDTGVCDCGSQDEHSQQDCRLCGKGCANCMLHEWHMTPYCTSCNKHYALFSYLGICLYVGADYDTPMGMTINGDEIQMIPDQTLFKYELSENEENFWNYVGSTYFARLCGGDYNEFERTQDRHDSIIHPTRGVWLDGKYDYMILKNVAIPPIFYIFMWIRADYAGTLFSTNAVHDERNQHVIHVGIRGNRLESGVQYGDDLQHAVSKNSIHELVPAPNIPPGSVHDKGPFIPLQYYSQTNMDVFTYDDWHQVGYGFDFAPAEDYFAFKYFYDNECVDTAFHHHIGQIHDAIGVYRTHNIFGAQERDDHLTNFYRGFMYSIASYNYDKIANATPIEPNDFKDGFWCKGGCDHCPLVPKDCLGMCKWNEFFNGIDCERCPDWCREGCDDGVCPTPTYNPWP